MGKIVRCGISFSNWEEAKKKKLRRTKDDLKSERSFTSIDNDNIKESWESTTVLLPSFSLLLPPISHPNI